MLFKPVFNKSVVHLAPGNDHPGPRSSIGLDGENGPVPSSQGNRLVESRPVDNQRDGACSGHRLPLNDRCVVVQGGAHNIRNEVEFNQSLRLNLEQTAVSRGQLQLALLGLSAEGDAGAGQRRRHLHHGVIFMDLVLFQIQDVEMAFAKPHQAA